MENPASLLSRVFRQIVAKRWWIVAFYGLLLGPSIFYALKVKQDNSLDRLIVSTDPDVVKNHQFEAVFGRGEYAVLLGEADDPYFPGVIAKLDGIERALSKVPRVEVNSALSTFRRAHPAISGTPEEAADFRKFATGTDLFRKQRIVGDHFLATALILDVSSAVEREETLEKVDAILRSTEEHPAPLTALRKVGEPYVNAYLDRDSKNTANRYFPLFGFFIIILNVALYRSWRTLLAFLLTLGTNAAMAVGYIGITGGGFTIVSSLVPMSILITCTATLVYLQSRFVERPADRSVDDHQIFALDNKFMACTASIFATAVGFAALAVSKIRPIREMGIWVAIGLGFTFLVVFTLFPALQKILRTPTTTKTSSDSSVFIKMTEWLPRFSYRYRWLLVPGSLLFCALGAVALFGIPKLLTPMKLETNAVEYINHESQLYKDTKYLERTIAGLSVTEVWLKGQGNAAVGGVTEPENLRGFEYFQHALEQDSNIGAVVGPSTILRSTRYAMGQGDKMPTDDTSLEQAGALLETMVPQEKMLQRFIDKKTLGQTHFTVITQKSDYQGIVELEKGVDARWAETVAKFPSLKQFEMIVTGMGPMQAKISYHLVPTLVDSFGLTVLIIFGTFLLVFRSGPARLMAMIPSLFAILVMFGIMRITSMSLNVATILIASTVLGTSENDQIHFFFHFLEKQKEGASAEMCLRHTLQVAGRAIFIATLINAGGFLAFGLADLPPVRQFGQLSAIAFLLSMIADFSALPAALWIVFREKPDQVKAEDKKKS